MRNSGTTTIRYSPASLPSWRMMGRSLLFVFLLWTSTTTLTRAQSQRADDYGYDDRGYAGSGPDYGDAGGGYGASSAAGDNLYADYAARQQDKEMGVAPGPGWTKLVGSGLVGWFVGSKFHCRRQKKKLDQKSKEELKALYQQYYEDVYALQLQNAELISALEQLGYKVQN